MSSALYSTCLIWTGSRGVAKLRGWQVILSVAPTPQGLMVAHVEYMPEVGVARVCETWGPWRDLERHEIRAIDCWLELLFDQQR